MIPDSKALEITRSLATVAALFHDLGKASDDFQKKLRTHSRKKDPLRHEWVSCKMLEAVWCLSGCGEDDETWMAAILNGNIDSRSIEAGLQRMQADDSMKKFPYSTPTIMRILMWLILTHHRMPMTKDYEKYEEVSLSSMGAVLKRIHAGWGYSNDEAADACLKFSLGVLLDDEDWASATKDALSALLKEKDAIFAINPQEMRLVLVLSREALMLADHSVSADKKSAEAKLYANTDSGGNLCEPLSSHLVRTAEQAERILAAMPQIADGMVAVEHVRFGRSPGRFKWQDDAVDKIRQNKDIMNSSAYFVLNMASTGCGKTTANAKIMQALSDDGKSMRYTLALGLRSLTLQTGAEYRERMHLSKDDLAVIIGSAAVQKLDEQERKQDRREPLIQEPLDYSSILDDEKIMRFLDIFLNDGKNAEKNKAYLLKPVLVTTIDQIIGATETVKGGRGLLPFLRLLSSDFVIDEIDDFSPEDLTAIARLVHLVGMLGRNIILSSATIPPDLAIGLYQAYADGLSCRNAFADKPKELKVMWVDEFSSAISGAPFAESHDAFIRARAAELGRQIIKRQAMIIPCCPSWSRKGAWHAYVDAVQQGILNLHEKNHVTDKATGKSVSFGLLRFANIDPCVNMALALSEKDWPDGTAMYFMCYHSRQVLLLRHEQERYLDAVLRRKDQQGEVIDFRDETVRKKLDTTTAQNVLFLVIATPVEEVGRDHDFDWAIIEPSSYRSIIQLAGRVLRHRPPSKDIDVPNIGIMEYNWRGMQKYNEENCVFNRPGFELESEDGRDQLRSHDMKKLVPEEEWQRIDAIPRIVKNVPLHAKDSLIDLEHKRLEDWRSLENKGPESLGGWQRGFWWMTGLPQRFHGFRAGSENIELCYRYFSAGECRICTKLDGEKYTEDSEFEYNILHYVIPEKVSEHLWIDRDYTACLHRQLELRGMPDTDENRQEMSKEFGQLMLTVQENRSRYWYSDQFGLFRDILKKG